MKKFTGFIIALLLAALLAIGGTTADAEADNGRVCYHGSGGSGCYDLSGSCESFMMWDGYATEDSGGAIECFNVPVYIPLWPGDQQ